MKPKPWDPECVVAAMRQWADEHDASPPTLLDWSPSLARHSGYPGKAEQFEQDERWPSSSVVAQLFGSWNAAIEQAGFTPMQPGLTRRYGEEGVRWTRDKLIDAVARWHGTYGALPVATDWCMHQRRQFGDEEGVRRLESGDWPSDSSVRAHFPSYDDLIRTAGFEPHVPALVAAGYDTNRWTRDIVLDTIRRFADEHDGTPPTLADCTRHAAPVTRRGRTTDTDEPGLVLPSPPTVRRFFASWSAALEAAGFAARRSGWNVSWTRDTIVDSIRQWRTAFGDPPREGNWRKPVQRDGVHSSHGTPQQPWPSSSHVTNLFGSFDDAIQAAGYVPHLRVTWTRETIIAAAQEWKQHHGRGPRATDWNRLTDKDAEFLGRSIHGTSEQPWPSTPTVTRIFGSWSVLAHELDEPDAHKFQWTREMIIDAGLEWVQRHGRRPRYDDWNRLASKDPSVIGRSSHGSSRQPWPSAPTVSRIFGSWSALTRTLADSP